MFCHSLYSSKPPQQNNCLPHHLAPFLSLRQGTPRTSLSITLGKSTGRPQDSAEASQAAQALASQEGHHFPSILLAACSLHTCPHISTHLLCGGLCSCPTLYVPAQPSMLHSLVLLPGDNAGCNPVGLYAYLSATVQRVWSCLLLGRGISGCFRKAHCTWKPV